jgi:hypothetical protein
VFTSEKVEFFRGAKRKKGVFFGLWFERRKSVWFVLLRLRRRRKKKEKSLEANMSRMRLIVKWRGKAEP